jgi:hypothetical protein
MFEWWNQAIKEENGFEEKAFRQFFTDDATIIINGKSRGKGISELARHFQSIQPNRDSVVVELPFIEEFRSGNKIFTHHKMTVTQNGVSSQRQLMGYAVVESGKISVVNLVSHTE